MNIKRILRELVGYLKNNRGAGHTTAMLEGALSNRCVVVSGTTDQALRLAREGIVLSLSVGDVSEFRLRGYKNPIAFDNSALEAILEQSVNRIESLESYVGILEKEISRLKERFDNSSVRLENKMLRGRYSTLVEVIDNVHAHVHKIENKIEKEDVL